MDTVNKPDKKITKITTCFTEWGQHSFWWMAESSSAYTVFCLHGCFSKVSKKQLKQRTPSTSTLKKSDYKLMKLTVCFTEQGNTLFDGWLNPPAPSRLITMSIRALNLPNNLAILKSVGLQWMFPKSHLIKSCVWDFCYETYCNI